MAPVSIPLVSRDTSEGTITEPASGTLTFTAANWSIAQTVTVTGVDDADEDGSVPYAVRFQPATSTDARYADRTTDDVMIVNVDDDSAGVTITGASNLTTTEAGGAATFRMVLNTAPSQGVTFFIRSNNTAEGVTNLDRVMFSVDDWNVPHPVIITGQQDTTADGNQLYYIVIDPAESSDQGYAGLVVDPLPVVNVDDDSLPATKQRRSNARPRPAADAHPAR
jgi:hypothetical protein